MNSPTRTRRHRRLALSSALAGALALGASGQAPAPGTTIPGANPGYAQPTYTSPKYGTSQPTYGPNTTGQFPPDPYRFSQSGAVRTPLPTSSPNIQVSPTGTFTPIPAH